MNYYCSTAAQAQRAAAAMYVRAEFWRDHGGYPTSIEAQQIAAKWYAMAREWYEAGKGSV